MYVYKSLKDGSRKGSAMQPRVDFENGFLGRKRKETRGVKSEIEIEVETESERTFTKL